MNFLVTRDNHLEFMKKFIISRYDTYAVQDNRGRYKRVEKPLTDAALNRHLERKITIGCYNSTPESRCKFALVDIDAHEGKKILPPDVVEGKLHRLITTLKEFGIPYVSAQSSPGNFHVYLFFYPSVETHKAYEYVRWVLRAADLPNEECFPKQREIPDGDYGNLLRLCFSEHRKKKTLYHFIDDEKTHIDEFQVQTLDLSCYEPRVKEMKPATAALPEDGTIRMKPTQNTSGSIPPCIEQSLAGGAQFTGSGGHYMRICVVCAYRDAGLPFAALSRLFTGQDDYDQVETAKQIKSVLKKEGGYSYSCNTLREKCLRFTDCQNCARGKGFK